jgi:transcriptional regulator with XRE-family HTH domain
MSFDVDPILPVGQRIKHFRQRTGMPRPVLAGLVGRTAEWLKAVENGRLLTPRLPMLLRIAQALNLDDLADLTGDGVRIGWVRASALVRELRCCSILSGEELVGDQSSEEPVSTVT